jgi:phage-related protein
MPIVAWTVETLNETVDAELAELPADMRGPLWEIRLKGKAGIAPALYVTAKAPRVVILRAFIKKTEKTPAGEIDLALQRAKELKP